MASENNRPTGGAITSINVTPLVDITLVLLIIFMVTAKVIVRRVALPVDLPRAVTGKEVQDIFSIVIEADGTEQVDGTTIAADAQILPLARAARGANPALRAVIKADGRVPYRHVMHVLDLLRQAGVSRVGFGVEPAPSRPATPQGAK